MSRRATAIILARAGSRGVPGKNTAELAGRACVEWSILAAGRAAGVGRVAVTSDCPRVLGLARAHGAVAIDRPPDLAHDTARIDDAARHAVETLDRAPGAPPADERDAFVLLYANVPVRPEGLIDRALDLLERSGADSVQSYTGVGKHHPWWTARLDAEGRVTPWEGDTLNHGVFRRQDLPAAWIPDGGVIALTRRALFLRVPGVAPGPHAFFGLDRRGVTTEPGSVVDIDTPEDLEVARVLLARRAAHGGA
jgi:CMP-N,N'-diacetyllegionaminic acid synthase